MPTLSSGHAIVCGLAAQSLKISMARPFLDVTRHDALYVNLTPGPPVIHAEFEFMLRPEELALYERKFQVGDGVFYRHGVAAGHRRLSRVRGPHDLRQPRHRVRGAQHCAGDIGVEG